MTVTEIERAQSPPSPVEPAELDLNLAEVKQLWSFLDGSIMNVDVRHHLWRSWGLCPRHTWCHAIADCAYRYSLFSTAILYEDLTARAADALRRPALRPGTVRRRLRSRDICFTCDYIAFASGDPNYRAKQQRANDRQRFNELLLMAEHVWSKRSCPLCLGGAGLVCRPHLLNTELDPPADLGEGLADIAARLHVFMKSMTWRGPDANDDHHSSWVEALSWFAGWQYPATAAAAARAGDHHARGGQR